MELAYNYDGLSRNGERINGTIYATDSDLAHFKLNQLGLRVDRVSLNLQSTFRLVFSTEFNQRDLARLYETLGKRVNLGRNLVDGMEDAAQFLMDDRLKQATQMLRRMIDDGQPIDEAMESAGFPMRDAAAVGATNAAGKLGDTLISLAEDIKRRAELRASIMRLLVMPAIMLALMYVFTYVQVTVIAPRMFKFITSWSAQVEFPPMVGAFFDFARWAEANLFIFSVLYAAMGIGIIWLVQSGVLLRMASQFPLAKRIAERADQSAQWSAFAMLYEAGINISESCRMLARSSTLRETAFWFDNLARQIAAGKSLGAGVERAGFPLYIVKGIKAAESSGDTADGVYTLARMLSQDVNDLSQRLQVWVNLGALLLSACFVMFFAMVTYFPLTLAVRANA